jgi:23S rRNA methylase
MNYNKNARKSKYNPRLNVANTDSSSSSQSLSPSQRTNLTRVSRTQPIIPATAIFPIPEQASKTSEEPMSQAPISKQSIADPLLPTEEQPTYNVEKISEDYKPIVVKLAEIEDTDIHIKPIFSLNIDYPKTAYGFQHFLHAQKNKMEIVNEFKNKKKVFRVMNLFERRVDNYSEDIDNVSKTYFNIGKSGAPDILSRGFFKLWELLFMFDLIDINNENFVSAHLADGSGGFVQATISYRDKFSNKSKNDKYYVITLHPEDQDDHVEDLDKTFTRYYEKEKPQRLFMHKTYPSQVAGSSPDKDNGDLTDPKTIRLFGGQMGKNRANLVTADGGINWENENTQEQEIFRLLYSQIVQTCKIQKKGGNTVIKFFETYTNTSVKLLYILSTMYEEIILAKPLSSRKSNSEKYAICRKFKYNENDKKYIEIMKNMENTLVEIHKKDKKYHIIDLLPNFIIPKSFIDPIIYLNNNIANKQVKSINEIVGFIKDQNYYGDVYQMRRQMQIDASKYWISLYFPPAKEISNISIQIRNNTKTIIDDNNKQIEILSKKITTP